MRGLSDQGGRATGFVVVFFFFALIRNIKFDDNCDVVLPFFSFSFFNLCYIVDLYIGR